MKKRPTASDVRLLLDYDSGTGIFRWRIDRSSMKAGAIAGGNKGAYTIICISGRLYRAHQLAWLLMTGEWPASFIDHIDLNKKNNAWSNLRLATKSQNGSNRPAQKNSASGIKGVYPYRAGASYGKPWQAGIQKNGKKIHLGHFPTIEEASAAYRVAAEQLYGEFARVQ